MKSKYETHIEPFLAQIADWTERGADEKEIAGKLGVAYSTFRKYLDLGKRGDERYTALSAAFTQACARVSDEVEAALYRAALGYTVPVKKTFKVRKIEYDPDTGKKLSEREELVEGYDEQHVPANVQAQVFWLCNRSPEAWQYRPAAKEMEDNAARGVVMMPEIAAEKEPEIVEVKDG